MITGKNNTYNIDAEVFISDKKIFEFKKVLAVFYISTPKNGFDFVREYVDAQYFDTINEKVFKTLKFGVYNPMGIFFINCTKDESIPIIKDIKESPNYVNYSNQH